MELIVGETNRNARETIAANIYNSVSVKIFQILMQKLILKFKKMGKKKYDFFKLFYYMNYQEIS